MKEFHKRNHYVPQLYLRQWCDDSQQVNTYKLLVSKNDLSSWRRYSPSAIGYHNHLYTQTINGQESDEFENWLSSEFESPAKNAISNAINGRSLSRSDWKSLVRFLAAQDLRTPARLIEHLNTSTNLERVLQNSLEDLKASLESGQVEELPIQSGTQSNRSKFPLKIIQHFDETTNSVTIRAESYIGRQSWLHGIQHLLEERSRDLLQQKWSIVKPAKGYKWFTSDNPVIKLNYFDDLNYDLGGGWGRKNGNIIFPISPDHAMFVQIGGKPFDKGTRLSVNQTIFFRKIIAQNAHRLIFSIDRDPQIPRIRPRLVSHEIFNRERQELQEWHNKNTALEKEFFG